MRLTACLLLLYIAIGIAAPTRDTNCSAFREYEQKWNVNQSTCPEMKKAIIAVDRISQQYFYCLLYNTSFTRLCSVDSSKINLEEMNNQTNKIKTIDDVCKTLQVNIDKIDGKEPFVESLKSVLHNNKACESMCGYLKLNKNNEIVLNPIDQCIASAVILSVLRTNENIPVEYTAVPKNDVVVKTNNTIAKLEQSKVNQPAVSGHVESSSPNENVITTVKQTTINTIQESNIGIQIKPGETSETENIPAKQPILTAEQPSEKQSQQSPSAPKETQEQKEENAEEDLREDANKISDNIIITTSTQKAVVKESMALPSADGNMPTDNQYAKSDETELGQDGDMEEEVFKETFEPKEKPPVTDEDNVSNTNYPNQPIAEDDSYFFSYFMLVCILFVLCYVGYHNKQKILALLLEGRKGKNQQRRRPNSANYHKLDSNLEEAVTSACNKNSASVIY